MRGSREGQQVIDEEVPCFVTKGSPSEDAAHRDHCEATIAFWGSTETETRTRQTTLSTVLDVDDEPETQDLFTQQKFLQPQREDRLCQERSDSVSDPHFCFDCAQYVILVQKHKLDKFLRGVVPEILRH